MNRTSLYLSVGALLIAAAAGCQAIAGLQTRDYDPQLTGCGLPAVGLPSTGNGRVRLANMANVGPGTSSANNPLNYTDFCIRTSGSSDWGRPLFRDGGNDALCLGTSSQPGGLAYSLSTVPFSVPVGKIDVKAIPSGQTCSTTAATSETDGITIGDSVNGTAPVMTLVRWGGGSTKEQIAALPERDKNIPSTEAGDATVRLINALSDGKSITFGTATSPLLPSTVSFATITAPVAPGTVPAPQPQGASLFAVDSTGYMEYPPQPVNFAAAYSTDTTAAAITDYPVPAAAYGTYYVIGDPGDPQNHHAVRAVYCDDVATAAASATTDAGAVGAVATIPAADRALLAQCTLSNLALLTVDMVNASLYGANAPFEEARELAIPAAIAARRSDIMCVVEVDDDTDARSPIIAAAANPTNGAQFPYSFDTVTTVSTPPTLPADNKGAPSTPPCGGSVNPQYVTNWLNCVDQNCSTVTNDTTGSGYLNGTSSCLEDSCLVSLLKIYTSPLKQGPGTETYEGDTCFDCTVYYLTSVQLSQAQNCVTQSVYPFAFAGQTPDLILSHYPLQNTKAYILPATGFRRSVLKAQVVLEDQTIDFFCAQLSSPFIDSTVPYTGNYGSDLGANSNGWQDEQDLQAQEALAWIQSETAADGLAAVIASDLHSSLPQQGSGGGDDAGALTKPQSTEVYDTFANANGIQVAIPQGYVEGCDYCPATAPAGQGTNPYNGDDGPYEIMHTFLLGFPQNATQSESLWGNDPTAVNLTSLPGEPAPASGTGPLFEYYAHSYQMLRPTPK